MIVLITLVLILIFFMMFFVNRKSSSITLSDSEYFFTNKNDEQIWGLLDENFLKNFDSIETKKIAKIMKK